MDENSRRRRTPARPETPTPQPGAIESARATSRRSHREIRDDDVQNSPRRRRTRNTHNENFRMGGADDAGSHLRDVSTNTVRRNHSSHTT